MTRRVALARRVAALEEAARPDGYRGALSQAERQELAALEADFARRFTGNIEDWPLSLVEEFINSQSLNGDGARLYDLQQRNRTAEQIEHDRARQVRYRAMSGEELDQELKRMCQEMTT